MGRIAQYLVVIYRLQQAEGTPVSTGRIAAKIDRSPPATTEMLQRLDGQGFVDYEPYAGVNLTPKGQEQARELNESYQTLCRFFRSVLELEDYEGEALDLVGIIDPTVTRRLETAVLPQESAK